MPTEAALLTQDNRADLIRTGQRVMQIEGSALLRFADLLDDNFADAVELILGIKGRVICSGMGKSGHVARKIAATLASTGTPAFFVHPAEASHGDLGMITEHDVALVLSNSGETKELADVVAHCKRFSIPLIGVASRAGSTLLRASDVVLKLPEEAEACSVGLAPTTSTTMTMALGDALAVSLMEQREFTAERFGTFHPGGKLGAQLVTVQDLMSTGDALPLVSDSAPMSEALLVMSEKGFGVAGTIDQDGRLTGVITDGDLRRNMNGLLERKACDVSTRAPRTIGPDALAQEALAQMNAEGARVTVLFVVDPDLALPAIPQGILHVHDCLRAGVDGG